MLFRSDRKSTRLNSSHTLISYAVFCLKKKNNKHNIYLYDSLIRQHACRHCYSSYLSHTAILPCPPITCYHLILYFFFFFFFFNDTATTEIYTLSLHDALPI